MVVLVLAASWVVAVYVNTTSTCVPCLTGLCFWGVLLGSWELLVPAHCLRLVLVAVLEAELSGSGFGGSVMMWG